MQILFRSFALLALAGCVSGGTLPGTASQSVASLQRVRASNALASQTLVIINDASQTSVAVGNDYAARRRVANVLHVSCIDSAANESNETIPVAAYRAEIEGPLRRYLARHSGINFIVTTKGVPIRVQGASTGEADSGQVRTSLDSLIAAFGYDVIPGAVKVRFNDPSGYAVGYAWLNRYWNANVRFSHAAFGGYLVTRLDGYTQADAIGLTTRAIRSEARLNDGQILLDIEPDFGLGYPSQEPTPITTTLITAEFPYDTFNADMSLAGTQLSERGIPVDADVTNAFVGRRSGLMGYYSWGSNDDHFSQAAYNSLKFAAGAIGDTAVSTSARSFFPQTYGQSMIADLIAQNITGVQGYTDEPLLQDVSSPSIVFDRYTRGYTLAESFSAGTHFVGWTAITVGDAIASPYASKP